MLRSQGMGAPTNKRWKEKAQAAVPPEFKRRDHLQIHPLTETMNSGCLQEAAADTRNVSQLHLSAGFQFQQAPGAETGWEPEKLVQSGKMPAVRDVAQLPEAIHTLKFPEFCKNKLTSTCLPPLSQELCQAAQQSQGQKAAPGWPGEELSEERHGLQILQRLDLKPIQMHLSLWYQGTIITVMEFTLLKLCGTWKITKNLSMLREVTLRQW